MSVFTQLEADKSGATKVSTKVDASARPMQFATTPTKCMTTELLENTILEVIKAKLNR
jgi:pyrrolidone-carboxylate peptidase